MWRTDCGKGVFVYRLGHGPLKAERRVRFPYALPITQFANEINCYVGFWTLEKWLVLKPGAKISTHFRYVFTRWLCLTPASTFLFRLRPQRYLLSENRQRQSRNAGHNKVV